MVAVFLTVWSSLEGPKGGNKRGNDSLVQDNSLSLSGTNLFTNKQLCQQHVNKSPYNSKNKKGDIHPPWSYKVTYPSELTRSKFKVHRLTGRSFEGNL